MKYVIKNTKIVNEGKIEDADVLISGGRIEKIAREIGGQNSAQEIDGEGCFLLPGLIDDQVHFREPGLTHKADIRTESRAAVAGGITSYMEMPNTVPNTLTQELLADKYGIAERNSIANYSFYMGASNNNLEEVLKTDPATVCGVKVFMGSSTGKMLVDDRDTLEGIFRSSPLLIATHCEDEETIQKNTKAYIDQYGEDIPVSAHPAIRSEEACYKSSSLAVELAKKHDARLHVLHISTRKELSLFDGEKPLTEKRITSEACIHHMWFSAEDYGQKGSRIKWNPAVKKATDREAIIEAVNNDVIDVIATDHAPHTLEEKERKYLEAPSGGPLVQHALPALFELWKSGKMTLEKIVEKACHNPAIMFRIRERGFIREGYKADLVLVNPESPWTVARDNIRYKSGWSPFEGDTFSSRVMSTFVSGNLVYHNGQLKEGTTGQRLEFDR